MADTSVSYKCPHCGAPIQFKPEAQTVTCDYCGTKFDAPYSKGCTRKRNKLAAEADAARQAKWQTEKAGNEWSDEEAARLKGYTARLAGLKSSATTIRWLPSAVIAAIRPSFPAAFRGCCGPTSSLPLKDEGRGRSGLETIL